ncbi:MAG: ATP-binding protein [Oscillospiraceae bacterium]|nr:ATP-binding protein [Oscillospiraceae bacterium]
MLYTLESAKANIRNREGHRVFYLGATDKLTAEARDYLHKEHIEILPPEQARPRRWKLLSGGFLEEKPEHMTHLNGDTLVPKTHPRIAFRGAVDTLEAELLLCMLDLPTQKKALEEILALARNLIRAEVLESPLEESTLLGLTREQLRSHSHRPQDFYGQPHFMPSAADGRELLLLNKLRCTIRNAERKAVAALPERQDILQALNRMSSAVYLLMIQRKAGK